MSITISTKINLSALKHVVMEKQGKNGLVKGLFIPFEVNNLFIGEKGIYLDLTGFELTNKKEGQKDTHLVKQSLPKEVFSKMTDEEKKSMPILGNHIVWGEQKTESYTPTVVNEADDLPF